VCLAQSLTCAVPVDLYGLSVCRGSRTSVAVGVMICKMICYHVCYS